ncbi:hypothetical protein C2S52_019934 [Perilla frutescens var. hirtella]|nr:hypothetical protein C2S52_019934 [Perilla frutescens var. hirtella]KAH6805839.1 hypothetical protein C2S51_030670 [Perilla frutescens var. frutescens]
MFTQEELSSYLGVLQVTPEFIEIDCGCTNPRYGDTSGKLRVYPDGKLEIDCTCRTGCDTVNVSPVEFAKHAGKINAHANWKSQIWVFSNEGHKIAVWRSCFLKYHKHNFQRRLRQVTHRDEFVRCCCCGKDRRFSLRTKQDCKIYHDALIELQRW